MPTGVVTLWTSPDISTNTQNVPAALPVAPWLAHLAVGLALPSPEGGDLMTPLAYLNSSDPVSWATHSPADIFYPTLISWAGIKDFTGLPSMDFLILMS